MFFLRLDLRGGWGRLPLTSTLVIGRSNTADLVLDSPTISRVHCRLKIEGEALFVEDLGSQTGTQRNGKRVEGPTQLAIGDMLQIGTFTLIIEDETRQALTRKKQAISALSTSDDIPIPVQLPTEQRKAARQLLEPLAAASSPKPQGALSALSTADDIPPPEVGSGEAQSPQLDFSDGLDARPTTEDFVPPPITGEVPSPPVNPADLTTEPVKAQRGHAPASTIIVDESALYDEGDGQG
jgi:predicted component of type VI protein secretion system